MARRSGMICGILARRASLLEPAPLAASLNQRMERCPPQRVTMSGFLMRSEREVSFLDSLALDHADHAILDI